MTQTERIAKKRQELLEKQQNFLSELRGMTQKEIQKKYGNVSAVWARMKYEEYLITKEEKALGLR